MSTRASCSPPAVVLDAPPDVLPNWLEAMRRGDFEAAWKQTDRIEVPRQLAARATVVRQEPHHLVWNGSPFADRAVLVRCEHGLGDTLQFLRYLPRLRQSARQVILKVQPALLDLLCKIDGADLVVNAWTNDPDPPHDLQIECMEFPYAFRDTIHTIPASVPYLPVESIRSRDHCRIAPSSKLKVGLIWAASSWDDTRSIPLPEFAPIVKGGHVTFYSLQQGVPGSAAIDLPTPLVALSEKTANVADAAAAMLQLDLIITVDSMTAHLAGGLGQPVWVLLKHDPDWRWMDSRSDSPWYPSMRLFRQRRAGDWISVVQEVATALAQLCSTHR